jgi:polar amino acid transport system substrate-binding protein
MKELIKKNDAFIIMQIIIFLLGTCVITCAKQQVTIYGDDAYPPYSYQENNRPKGIYVEILKHAFSEMPDYEVTIKMTHWNLGLSCIKRGECMALFPPYSVENRFPWMQLSEPILKEEIVVFGKIEKLKGKTKWPQDFLGSQIGLNKGFSFDALGGNGFVEACKSGKIFVQEARNNEYNLKKLEKGRIDFYLNDRLIDTSKHPSIVRGLVTKTNYGHLGFTRNDKNFNYLFNFKKQFDSIIQKMKSSNQIEKIIAKYLKDRDISINSE